MALLLDTHVLLWWLFGDKKLSPLVGKEIKNHKNDIFVSSVSVWEITTKYRIGKLLGVKNIVYDLPKIIQSQQMQTLPISVEHALLAGSFEMMHRDPFDRMLAAQSKIESLPLATSDRHLKQFDIELLW